MITLKDTEAKENDLKLLRANWQKVNRERRKWLAKTPFDPFPEEEKWDDYRIAWNLSKGDMREVAYNYEVLGMSFLLLTTLGLDNGGSNTVGGLLRQLELPKKEMGVFVHSLREMEEQKVITIDRDTCPEVAVPGTQLNIYGLEFVPGHGQTQLICDACMVKKI